MIGINYNYYNNLDLFKWVRDYYLCLDTEGYKFTVVDDGSQKVPLPLDEIPEDWLFYLVTEDVGWNCNGARNLIMRETDIDWNIQIDLDMVITPQSLKYIRENIDTFNPYKVLNFASLPYNLIPTTPALVKKYGWELTEEDKNSQYSCGYNVYICTKELFWQKGGYAELAHNGEYGGDYFLLDKFKPWQMDPNLTYFKVIYDATPKEWKNESKRRFGYKNIGKDDGKRVNFNWKRIR
jgi:hypothetical protein